MYKVIDYYDSVHGDIIGKFNTYEEARKFAHHWYKYETDGECDLEIVRVENGSDVEIIIF